MTATRQSATPWAKWGLIGLLIAGIVTAFVTLPITDWMLSLVDWLRGLGAVGVVLFALTYIVATVLALPGSILTLAAGFAYGPIWGFLLVSPVSVAAATAAFLLGRTVFRKRVEARVAGSPKLQAIDTAVNEGGALIVMLLRLSPVLPFNLLNYLLSLTSVKATSYIWASFVGMIPGTFLYVYLGSTLPALGASLDSAADTGPWRTVLFFGGLAATLLVTVLVTRAAKRALARHVALDDGAASPS